MSAALSRGHRQAVLGLWLALVALALVAVARAHYTADLSAFLPGSPDARQRLLITQLQSGAPSRTLLIGIEGADAPARAAASRALAASLRASGLFEQVHNGEREAFAEAGRWLFEHRYLLSPAVTPERFSAAGLHDALAETLSLLGTPAGAAARELLPRDPTGEMQRIAETLIPAEAPRLEGGVWVSRRSQRAVLLASTRADGADLDAQQAAIERVRAAFSELKSTAVAAPASATSPTSAAPAVADAAAARAAAGPRSLELRLSGAPVFSVQSRALIEREVHWLSIAGTAVMATLLLAAFASARALGAALLPVASGVLAGIAAVSLAFGQVHGMTLGFGVTLIGESVDYAIYYLVQARRRGALEPGTGWRRWLHGSWPTVRLGLSTSLCGFAALVFSGFAGLAQLGVFSVAGLVGAALTTRWLLPVLLPDGAPGEGVRQGLGRAGARLFAWLPRLRLPALALGALALALLVALAQRGELWRADLAALSPLPAGLLAADSELRADLGAHDARTLVVVQGDDAETTLARTEAAAARLEALVQQGRLGGFDSVTRWLPSRATQQQRLASLPEPQALAAALALAVRGTPIERSAATLLAPFADEIERARAAAPLTPEQAAAGPAKPLIDALLLRPSPRVAGAAGAASTPYTALLPLQAPAREAAGAHDAAALAQALATALQGLPGTQVLDIKLELDALYQRYLHEALWQAALGALAVVALVGAALRSARRTLAVCQPLALAVVGVLAASALAGASLGILHLVGLLLVVAVGSNYALFFDQSFDPAIAPASPRPGDTGTAGTADRPHAAAPPATGLADPDTLASLLLANLTTVAAFGLLAFSKIPALAAIGQVVAPGALLALVLAAVFAHRPRAPAAGGVPGPV